LEPGTLDLEASALPRDTLRVVS